MADVTLGAHFQVTVVGQYCGQTTNNTYPHVITAVPGAAVTWFDFFDALDIQWKLAGKLLSTQAGCSPSNWRHAETWYQAITPTRYRKVIRTSTKVGTFVDEDGLTANVQATIERFAERSGRRNQGAVRIPIGTDGSCFDNGELSIALKTALEAHAAQMTSSTAQLAVTCQPLTGLNADPADAMRIYGTSVKETVRVIRRRTVRVGI